jgi:hypothetical protein
MTAIADEDLVEISDVVSKRRRSTRGETGSRLPLVAVTLAGVLLLGVLGYLFKDEVLAKLRPVVTPPPVAEPPTSDRLTAEEVQLAVDGERPRFLDNCYRSGNRAFRRISAVTAKLVIPSTGGVAAVTLAPTAKRMGKPGPCVEKLLFGLKFRPHSAPKFEANVDLPSPKDTPTGRSAPPPPPSNGGSAAKALTGPEIQGTVQRHSAPIAKCLNSLAGVPNPPKKVNATINIAQSGRVTSVTFAPALPKAAVEQCLRRSLKGLRFRKQPVKDFKVTIPLTITQI